MNLAVIDIGSNSVRLLLNGEKTTVNTQLAEKIDVNSELLPEAMERTARAVVSFVDTAAKAGAKAKVFATEAVRSAKNKETFLTMLKESGVKVDILSPEKEAQTGFFGAYYGQGTKAVLDVGGASSELAIGDKNGIIYAHSLPLGAVRLKDYSEDNGKRRAYAESRAREYGQTPIFSELISIGGTTSSIVAVRDGVSPYDPKKIHLQKLTLNDVEAVAKMISDTPVEKRTEIVGLHPKKIHILPAGGILVAEIMKYLKINEITVSESDNLEGYVKLNNNE